MRDTMPSKRLLEDYSGTSRFDDSTNRVSELDYAKKFQIKLAEKWLDAMNYVDDAHAFKNYAFDQKQKEMLFSKLVKYLGYAVTDDVVYTKEEKTLFTDIILQHYNKNLIAKQSSTALSVVTEEVMNEISDQIKQNNGTVSERSSKGLLFLSEVSEANSNALEKALIRLQENNVVSKSFEVFNNILSRNSTLSENQLIRFEGKVLSLYSDGMFSCLRNLSKNQSVSAFEQQDCVVKEKVVELLSNRLSTFEQMIENSNFDFAWQEDQFNIAKNVILIQKQIENSWLKNFSEEKGFRNIITLASEMTELLHENGMKVPELKNQETLVERIKKTFSVNTNQHSTNAKVKKTVLKSKPI
jgi:hypothetical protein